MFSEVFTFFKYFSVTVFRLNAEQLPVWRFTASVTSDKSVIPKFSKLQAKKQNQNSNPEAVCLLIQFSNEAKHKSASLPDRRVNERIH